MHVGGGTGVPAGHGVSGEAAPLDDTVVQRAREGDHHAFGELWSALAPAVRAFVWSRGAREPDDVTSEVFLSFLQSLGRASGGLDEARALLFTIAHRRVADEYRSRSRRPDTAPWSAADDRRSTPSAEHAALTAIAGEAALGALDVLTTDQREVLTLRIYGDLSLEQVAAAVGKRPAAVKALQHRAVETLRRRSAELGLDALLRGGDEEVA